MGGYRNVAYKSNIVRFHVHTRFDGLSPSFICLHYCLGWVGVDCLSLQISFSNPPFFFPFIAACANRSQTVSLLT